MRETNDGQINLAMWSWFDMMVSYNSYSDLWRFILFCWGGLVDLLNNVNFAIIPRKHQDSVVAEVVGSLSVSLAGASQEQVIAAAWQKEMTWSEQGQKFDGDFHPKLNGTLPTDP